MKASWVRCRWMVVLGGIFLLASYIIAVSYYKVDMRPRAVLYQLLDPPGHDHLGLDSKVVVNELDVIHQQLVRAAVQRKPPSSQLIHQLANLILRLEPRLSLDSNKPNGTQVDVCPDKYMGPRFGHPYFERGFARENCTNARPLPSIVSFAIHFKERPEATASVQCSCEDTVTKVLGGIRRFYAHVPVHATASSDACLRLLRTYDNVVSVGSAQGQTAGQVWTELIQRVKTKYVVVARDLEHFWHFSNLERQVHVISEVPGVRVVGGSYRNATRHWHAGCLQSRMKNYVLGYQSGYEISRNECMFCDHVVGPFVALKEVFQEVPLDPDLPEGVVFADFFLALKEKQIFSMVCPDVMYYHTPSAHDRGSWLAVANKWRLNRVSLQDGTSHEYTCQETDMSCKDLKTLTRFYLMPPCCVGEMAMAMKFMQDFCANQSIHYEFLFGSVLGAVKMADVIPWDLDGDSTYYTSNHSVFKDARDWFELNGFSLTSIEDPVFNDKGEYKSTGYVQFNTPQMYIEMWGDSQMADQVITPEDLRGSHTLIEVHGVWVNGPPSPGGFARNRYGVEILKHAQSWIHVGKASSWEQYDAGHFKPCPKHNFHSCLDRFPTDGSIAFKSNIP